MNEFTIKINDYLKQNIQGFYHTDYLKYRSPNNPDYLGELKNDFGSKPRDVTEQAQQELLSVLRVDFPDVQQRINKNPITICVVPRAKADNTYQPNQLLFKATIKTAINELDNNFIDGTNFIQRHTNTKTTHLRQPIEGYINDGSNPYVGITNATCHISNDVLGKDILLIDDIYTKTINIDEDVIQALISKGANSVSFYAIGKTVSIETIPNKLFQSINKKN